MSGRAWLAAALAFALVATLVWQYAAPPAGTPSPAAGEVATCRPPPWGDASRAPLQSTVPRDLRPIRLQAATLTPLAGFQLEARVLARRDYDAGRESELSPTDLAVGWGRMREDAVLDRLQITQSGRWYRYRWSGEPPLPPAEIVRSSANMHFIPANVAAARALERVRAGDRVRVHGWLVEAVAPDGWTWRSSLSREDSGDGACEIIYVCSLSRL